MKHNFEAAYKKKKSGKLKWISCFANTSAEADNKMDAYIAKEYGGTYRRYAGSLPIKPHVATQ